jgi:uncharacterized protein (TIGR00369 family)
MRRCGSASLSTTRRGFTDFEGLLNDITSRFNGTIGSIMTDKGIGAMREVAQGMFDQALADERHEFGSFFLSRFLGMQIAYENDSCIVSLEVKPPMYNPQGSLHGGVLATALDISMGHLLHHRFGAGSTLEMKVQYFSPARSGLVRCQSGFLKQGRSIFFLQSHAYDAAGETLAHATSTWKLLKK